VSADEEGDNESDNKYKCELARIAYKRNGKAHNMAHNTQLNHPMDDLCAAMTSDH
jgi:hypothetical protein